jgi:uncharacterized protein
MRPGRPRCIRRVEKEPAVSYFKPQGIPLSDLDLVTLSLEELESVRLIDLEGLNQEEAAQRMGISRRALWEDLQNARRKIAEGLVQGKAIEIKGGNYSVERPIRFTCSVCHSEWEAFTSSGGQTLCPKCGGNDVLVSPENVRDVKRKGCCHGQCRKEGSPGAGEGSSSDG